MERHAATTFVVGVTALAVGTAAALEWRRDGRDMSDAAADVAVEHAQRGASGQSLSQEAVAISAVQAHLRNARVQGQLFDIRLYPRPKSDEVVVCGMVPTAGAQPIQVVAKVIVNRPTSIAQWSEAQVGPMAPRVVDTMVVMEAGPGLGHGGLQGGPAHRYCRDTGVAASAGGATAAAVVRTESDVATPSEIRVVVVTPARIRAAPASVGAILGTAQRQQSYLMLGRAPGGWIRLGDGQTSLGWAHSSLFAPPL